MRRFVFVIIPALICGFIFASCNSDKAEPQDAKITGKLYVMGAKSATDSTVDQLEEDQLYLLFTGDDIKSFNTRCAYSAPNDGTCYGEIVFTDFNVEDISWSFWDYTMIYIFIDETLIFDPPIKIFNPISSFSANDLQMSILNGKIYLIEFYQIWDWLPAAERNELLKAQQENSRMRKKQLDTFFKYLKDSGKVVK